LELFIIVKVFFNSIAWLGALVTGLSIPLAYSSGGYNVDMYEMGLDFAMIVCALGVLLFILGGLISRGLRPGVLDYLGLEAALEGLAHDINEKGNLLEVRLEVKGKERRLPDEVELPLFQIAQESLNNCQKHSQASQARSISAFIRTELN
jgi:glucose-6-phosphate-specific signal transduction histidine kinase